MPQVLYTKRTHSVKTIVHLEPPQPKPSDARWSSALLRFFIALLLFESLTGFSIFFLGRYLPFSHEIFLAHWVLGFSLIPLSLIYLWNHYQRIQSLPKQLIYQLGVLSFYTLFMTIFTGIPLIWQNESNAWYQALDLMHLFFSSLFLVVLPTHLFLLLRRFLLRSQNELPQGTLTTLLWFPFVFSVLTFSLFYLLTS